MHLLLHTHFFPLVTVVVTVASSERQKEGWHSPLSHHSQQIRQSGRKPFRRTKHRAWHIVFSDMTDDLGIRSIGVRCAVLMDGLLQNLLAHLHASYVTCRR